MFLLSLFLENKPKEIRMTINIKIEATANQIKYPILAKSNSSELIMFFTDLKEGFALTSGDDIEAGAYEYNLIDVDNQNEWTILPPGFKVILENGA